MTATEAIAEALRERPLPAEMCERDAAAAVAALCEAIRRDPQVLQELGMEQVGWGRDRGRGHEWAMYEMPDGFPVFAVAERSPHGKADDA